MLKYAGLSCHLLDPCLKTNINEIDSIKVPKHLVLSVHWGGLDPSHPRLCVHGSGATLYCSIACSGQGAVCLKQTRQYSVALSLHLVHGSEWV